MSRHFHESYRAIMSFQTNPDWPARLIMDVYDDGYTPFDVIAAVTMWVLEDPGVLERFRRYIDSTGGTTSDPDGQFTGQEAETHLRFLMQVFHEVSMAPGRIVYVTGNKGWIN